MLRKIILPNSSSFKIIRKRRGRCNFVYTERVTKGKKAALKLAVECLRRGLGKGFSVRTTHKGLGFRVTGRNVSYQIAAGMIAAEFIGWSSIGDTTFRDLMGSFALMAAHEKHPIHR